MKVKQLHFKNINKKLPSGSIKHPTGRIKLPSGI